MNRHLSHWYSTTYKVRTCPTVKETYTTVKKSFLTVKKSFQKRKKSFQYSEKIFTFVERFINSNTRNFMGKAITNEQVIKRRNEAGEVIEEVRSKTWTFSKNSEPFFLTYLNCISWMYNLKSLTTIKVLYKLLEVSNFNKGTVDITTTRRQAICSNLNISDTSFSKSLRSLIELNILNGEKGTYAINAEIFWKGDYKTREALLNSGCKITIEPNDEFKIEE